MKRVVVLSAWCICGRSRAFTVLKRAKCVVQNFLNKTDPRVKNLVHFVNDEDKAAEFAYALSLEGEYLTQNATQMVVAAADHVQLALDMERLAALTKTHANSSRTAEDVQAAVKATRQVLDQVHAAQRWLSEAEDMVTDTVQIMARVESANTEAASSAATSIHAIRLLRRYGESVAEDFACGRSLARVSRKRALKREEDCVDLLCQACVDLRQVMLKLGTLRQHGNGSSRPSSSTHPLSFVKWLSERDENGCSRVVDPATALDDAEVCATRAGARFVPVAAVPRQPVLPHVSCGSGVVLPTVPCLPLQKFLGGKNVC
jgi:hypothetical protein